jgi:hypothetical protein
MVGPPDLIFFFKLPRHFHLAVDFLGLRQGWSWPQVVDQPQDFLKQIA